MRIPKNITKECKENSKYLTRTADNLSLTYVICIFLSIGITILLLGGWIGNHLINFIIGSIGLLATIIPLIIKKNIEKIQGYRELSIEFKNLEQDFTHSRNKNRNLEQLKKLRKKLSEYPINRFSKWQVNRK